MLKITLDYNIKKQKQKKNSGVFLEVICDGG